MKLGSKVLVHNHFLRRWGDDADHTGQVMSMGLPFGDSEITVYLDEPLSNGQRSVIVLAGEVTLLRDGYPTQQAAAPNSYKVFP